MLKLVVFCVVGVVWLQLPSKGGAECCWGSLIVNGHGKNVTKCSDCKKADPYCGTPVDAYPFPDDCNILGCDCSSCRVGTCFRKMTVESRTANPRALFYYADSNRDGKLDLVEAHVFLLGKGIKHSKDDLYEMDENKDQVLSVKEIDSRYKL